MTKMMTSRDYGIISEQNFSFKVFLHRFLSKQKLSLKQCQFYSTNPLPNPCRVKIKNGIQDNNVKQNVYLPKILLKISNKDIIIKEKILRD